jgi:hypothetical protein
MREQGNENSKFIKVSKGEPKMLTKTFEAKELMAFSNLRSISQKELLRALDTNEKLGIVIKDQLKVAMIDMDSYQSLVETAQEYERLLEWMEEQELFNQVGHRLNNDEGWEGIPDGMSLREWASPSPTGN